MLHAMPSSHRHIATVLRARKDRGSVFVGTRSCGTGDQKRLFPRSTGTTMDAGEHSTLECGIA